MMVYLLAISDVMAGAALLTPAKTTGSTLTATFVIDVTPGSAGATSIRVQKASLSRAAIFQSDYVQNINWTPGCLRIGYVDLKISTASAFTGFIDTLINNAPIYASLFSAFNPPVNQIAAIVDQDYVSCTVVGGRQIVSFSATIQFGTL